MATMVCQGLQSCLETQLNEPRKFMLKLSSPRAHFSDQLAFTSRFAKEVDDEKSGFEEIFNKTSICSSDDKASPSLPDVGGWSFLQAISSTRPKEITGEEEEKPYVHPMAKRSLSSLSAKSLELCTEKLGNETGCDMLDDDTIFSLSSSGNYNEEEANSDDVVPSRQLSKARDKKSAASRDFPPPLTTIRGSESIRVQSHREEGRLVIEAVKVPAPRNIFKAERSNGRLRLILLEDDEAEAENDEMESEEFENGGDRFDKSGDQGLEESGSEAETTERAGEEEDTEGTGVKVGGKTGMEKILRGGTGRCKEGEHEMQHEKNKGLFNWEPFWVATTS